MNGPDFKADPTATWIAEVSRNAIAIADRAVIELIESEGTRGHPEGWLDVGPLVDEREVRPPDLDVHRAYLAYAELRRLIFRHPQHPHLVRIARRP